MEALSIKECDQRIDRYWRDQEIAYNYEVALISCHTGPADNDISIDSADNDLKTRVKHLLISRHIKLS